MKAAGYRLAYRGDIEGLRAIAILLVIAVHADVPGLAGGYVGVDIFFVLSGFLITGLLVREIETTQSMDFLGFYLRRLRRLLPAMAVMLVLTSVAAACLLSPSELASQANALQAASLWLSNIYFSFSGGSYFDVSVQENLFLHTWSLGVEEQFYLIWPWFVLCLLRNESFDKGVIRLNRGLFVAIAVSFVSCVWMSYVTPRLAFYMAPMRAWEFAAGAGLWMQRNRIASVGKGPLADAVGWIGLGLILLSATIFDGYVAYPSWRAVVPAVGALCVLAAGANPRQGIARCLAWHPLQFIGRLSYSWYLWHWPMLLLGKVLFDSHGAVYRVVEILVSFLLAYASYRWIEVPIRHNSWWLVRRGMAIRVSLLIMLAGCGAAVRWSVHENQAASAGDYPALTRARVDAPAIYGMGCDDWYRSDRLKPCSFGDPNARHVAVLIGDSVVAQWAPAMQQIFLGQGWRFVVLTKSSCPMVEAPYFYVTIGRDYTECARWRDRAIDWLRGLKPDAVVLGNVATDQFSKDDWIAGSTLVLNKLKDSAGRLYVLRGTPRLPFDGPSCLAQHVGRPTWLGSRMTCSAKSTDPHDELVWRWQQEAGNGISNMSYIDMNDAICPAAQCHAEYDGVVAFRDNQHLTATYVRQLAPELARRMRERKS